MTSPTDQPAHGPLTRTVQAVADEPTDANRQSFLDALGGAGELVFEISGLAPRSEGEHVVGPADDIQLTTAKPASTGGREFLVAFPDIDAARRARPDGTHAGIAAPTAFQLVLDGQLDGILVASGTADEAWAVADRDELARLLDA